MKTRYRKIQCPDPEDGIRYRAMCEATGEILESADLAALLRRVAAGFEWGNPSWEIEIHKEAKVVLVPEDWEDWWR